MLTTIADTKKTIERAIERVCHCSERVSRSNEHLFMLEHGFVTPWYDRDHSLYLAEHDLEDAVEDLDEARIELNSLINMLPNSAALEQAVERFISGKNQIRFAGKHNIRAVEDELRKAEAELSALIDELR